MKHMRVEHIEEVTHESVRMCEITVGIGDADDKIVNAVFLSAGAEPCIPVLTYLYGRGDAEKVKRALKRLVPC